MSQTIRLKTGQTYTSQQLEDIDHALSIARSRLREIRNSALPVNKLPPEVLTTIFKYSCPAREPPPIPASMIPPPFYDAAQVKPWIRQMTHVCRYWRDAAFGTSSLWNSIIFKPNDLLHDNSIPYTCLRRALSGPLDVTIHPGAASEIENTWAHLIPVAKRLRQLHIRNIPSTALRTWASPLQHIALPALEILRVRALSPLALRARSYFPQLPQIFNGSIPMLKHLDISGFTNFSVNRFANLTSLRLSYQTYTLEGLPGLFGLIEASPSLQRLMFSYCELGPDPVVPPSTTSLEERLIPLHSLRHLTLLDCQATFMTIILSRLDTPLENNFLICGGWYPKDRRVTWLFSPEKLPGIRSFHSITSLHVGFNKDMARINATSTSSAVQLLISDTYDLPRSLPTILPLYTLKELKLSGNDNAQSIVWSHAFLSMSRLSRLVLHLAPLRPVEWLHALIPVWKDGEIICPAPHITELCIYPPVPHGWDTLSACTRERRRVLGYPLTRLRIMLPSEEEQAHSSRGTFDAWKLRCEELQATVEEVQFEAGDGYYVQDAPERIKPYMFKAQLETWS